MEADVIREQQAVQSRTRRPLETSVEVGMPWLDPQHHKKN